MNYLVEIRRMLRFFSVSVVCAALDALVGLLGVNVLRWPLSVSVVAGFLCGLVLGYLLHNFWTFQAAAAPQVRTGLKFFTASVALLGARLVFVWLAKQIMAMLGIAAEPFSESMLYLLMLGFSFFVNYGLCRNWVFRQTA